MERSWRKVAVGLAMLAACGKSLSQHSDAPGFDPAKVSLTYVCENRFKALNFNSVAGAVSWSVENSGDQGEISLPPPPVGQTASETFFATRAIGTVVISAGGVRIGSAPNQQAVCPTDASPLIQVAVSPGAASVSPRGTQQFSAQVTGDSDTAVVWSVQEGAAGGFVDATGLYTAPAGTGTFHVIATSHADPRRSSTAVVGVQTQPIQVAVSPTTASITPLGTLQFNAHVSGSADTALLWSVREGASGGSVDAGGLYHAPAASGTFHVIATSHADPARSGTATVTVSAAARPLGEWGLPQGWPLVPIHVALLHDGRVLSWSRLEQPHVWDPANNSFLEVPALSWEFCAGLTFMPDGKLIVTGGHITDNFGLPDVNIFDPDTSTWSSAPPMAAGRWYPTVIELADGSVVVVAGNKADSTSNLIPEVRNPDGTWRELTTASLEVPFYPSLFLAPNGLVFMAGSDPHSKYLDTRGTGAWLPGPKSSFGLRDYGAAVQYAPGKIILAGGGWTPTATAEVINLNDPTPAWRFTGSMAHARRQVTGTVLPDGKVLITGGTSGTGFNDEAHAVLSAELWDPATDRFTELSSMRILRVYHSTALLMPDARVLVGGGGQGAGGTDEPNVEMFSPPYLFNADGSLAGRPTISDAPQAVTYGVQFAVSSPDAAAVASVALVRTGALTHTFNTTQVRVPVSFSASGTTLTLTAPSGPTVAPPGDYMLFLLDAKGVPSVARIVHIG
jgi:hypothetical protein